MSARFGRNKRRAARAAVAAAVESAERARRSENYWHMVAETRRRAVVDELVKSDPWVDMLQRAIVRELAGRMKPEIQEVAQRVLDIATSNGAKLRMARVQDFSPMSETVISIDVDFRGARVRIAC